jgi:hypothetical protein
MKNNTFTGTLMPTILILLCACTASKVNNQSSYNKNFVAVSSPDATPAETGNAVYRNDIHIKAVRHFRKSFPAVKDERWFIIQNGYMAKYKTGDTNIRIDYDQHGNWLYSIRYITEKDLPRIVRAQVKSTWYDYTISSVEQIEIGHHPLIYILHIHEGEEWKIIRVCDGEMSEMIPPGKGE